MNVALLPLMPRGVEFRNRPYRLLKDRHIYDQASVATSDTTEDFFQTLSGKKKSQANFAGDLSLVKEANLFLVTALQAKVRDRVLPRAEALPFWNKGAYVWNVTVPETVVVDEDKLAHIADGPGLEHFSTENDSSLTEPNDRCYTGRRTYLVGENKIVPGGRAVEFTAKWEESGGNGLSTATDLAIIFAGGEYEPGRAK